MKNASNRIFTEYFFLHLDFPFFPSQVHDYYKQALQFLDTQGPSFMGSKKAKVHMLLIDLWEDLCVK